MPNFIDEPAASLDYANQQRLTYVIRSLAQNGYCIIMSTHSPEHLASLGSLVLLMKDGKSASFGTSSQVITPQNLKQVYGIDMDVLTVTNRHGAKRTICLPV